MAISPIDPTSVTWDGGPAPQQPQASLDPSAVKWDGPPVSQDTNFTPDEQKQWLSYLQGRQSTKPKSGADLDAYARHITGGRVGISNGDEIFKDYSQTKRKIYGFTSDPNAHDVAPEPDVSAGDYAKGAAESLGRGVVNTLGFIDDAVNPIQGVKDLVADTKGLYHAATGGPTPEDVKNITDRAGPGFFEKNSGDVYDSIAGRRPAKTALQRYLNAGAYGVGGALVPIGGGPLKSLRGAVGTTAAGVGAGVGSQAGADLFPNSPVAPLIGGLLGGHVAGTPFALGPIRDNVAVAKTVEGNPEAKYLPGAVDAMADKAADVAPGGLVPKGRGKLTVTQINRVATQHLLGMPDDLNRLVKSNMLDPETARSLKLAIQNKDGITAPEIDALRGTPEGNAVAEALSHYRAVQNLTKPYGGDGRGILSKSWNTLVKVVPMPKLLADAISVKPGDVNASRIRGADKAINRQAVFQRLQVKTGPSPVGPALDAFQQRVADSFDTPAPTTGPKLSPLDQALSEQISGGLKGSGNALNAYASILNVKPEDVTRALDKIDVPEAFRFEAKKLVHGYNTNRTSQQVLLPRLRQALTDDGTIAARAAEKKASAKAAEPATSAAPDATPAPEAPPEAQDPNTSGNYRDIRRKPQWEQAKAERQAAFDAEVGKLSQEDSPHSQEIVTASQDGLQHIRDREKTVESAMRYFDDHLGPQLRAKDFLPEEIADLRQDVEKAAVAGKTYRTDTEFEKGAKVGRRGRPRNPPPSDEVPF